MPSNYPVIAVAPAFGVRLSRSEDQNTVRVDIDDHGGRGRPWAVIFFPVVAVGNKLQVLISGANGPPPYGQNVLLNASHVIGLNDPAPPYKVKVDRAALKPPNPAANWPFDTDLVLALLLYLQSPEVGADPWIEIISMPDAGATTQPPVDLARYWPKVTEAVNIRLEKSSVDELRGGLIRRRSVKNTSGQGDPAQAKQASSLTSMTSVTFSLASCQYPSDFFDRTPDDASKLGPADTSLAALGDLVKNSGEPSLMLFVGDQVYVDATAGLFDPKVQDDRFRLPYEQRGESRGAKAALQYSDVDVHMIPDDHEICDNWEPGAPTEPHEKPPIKLGTDAYWKYQRIDPPDPPSNNIWRAIVHGELPFFLGDTRTRRDGRTAMKWRRQKIMDDEQFKALRKWMKNKNETELPMFVTTASAVLPRHLAVAQDPACALHSDAWDGYPKSMHDLLAYVCDHEIKGLVFLSGDEHISNWVHASVTNLDTGACCTFHSVHSSALYAPYPFANSVKEDFARNETFKFPDSKDGPYCCEVRTVFAPEGDGFALLTALPPNDVDDWKLKVVFHDAHGPKNGGEHTLNLFPPDE